MKNTVPAFPNDDIIVLIIIGIIVWREVWTMISSTTPYLSYHIMYYIVHDILVQRTYKFNHDFISVYIISSMFFGRIFNYVLCYHMEPQLAKCHMIFGHMIRRYNIILQYRFWYFVNIAVKDCVEDQHQFDPCDQFDSWDNDSLQFWSTQWQDWSISRGCRAGDIPV
jgi:hypothetical protein